MNLKKCTVLAGLALMVALLLLPGSASAIRFVESPSSPLANPSPDNAVSDFAIADLDGNGNDDIVKVGPSNKIYVFLADNDGNGFHAAPESPFGTSSTVDYKTFVYAGDFGGDSAIDLLVGNNAVFETYLGGGNGTFSATASFFAGLLIGGTVPGNPTAMADVNHDGHPDLIAAGNEHKVYVALGIGDASGTFTAPSGSPFNVPTANNDAADSFWQITVGDFNGNGDPDLALLNKKPGTPGGSADGIYVAYGSGDGTFSPPPSGNPVATAGAGEQINDIAAIDLVSGGAYDDLAYSIYSESPQMNEVRTMLGTNAGLVPSEDEEGGHFSFLDYSVPNQLVITDVDGDLRDDIIVLMRNTKIEVLLNDGDQSISRAPGDVIRLPDTVGALELLPSGINAGDFNGDGFPDFAASSGHPGSPLYARAIIPMISKADPVVSDQFGFPETRPGQTSAPHAFTLTNRGAPPLYIDGHEVMSNGAQFEWNVSDCPIQLDAGESCEIVGSFKPLIHGIFNSQVKLTFGDGAGEASVGGYGSTGIDASVSPETGSFGEVVTGYEPGYKVLTFTIGSIGTGPLELGDPEITGSHAQYFYIVDPHTCDATLGAGAGLDPPPSCQIQVKFAPTGNVGGALEAQLSFGQNNDPDPFEIQLNGDGRDSAFTVAPATAQDFGEGKIGTGITRVAKTFTVTSNGEIDLPINGASISGVNADSFEISSNDCPDELANDDSTCEIKVIFDPTSGVAGVRSAALDIDLYGTGQTAPSIALTGTATVDPPPPGSPKLSLSLKTAKKVKAGKKLMVTATVRNSGSADSAAIVLKPIAPRKFAGKVKPIRIKVVPFGKSAVRKFRIPVKRTAKGKFSVKISMTHRGTTVSKQTAKIKVQAPARKK